MVIQSSYVVAILLVLHGVVTCCNALILPHPVSRNLALNKPAWQSSTYPYTDYYEFEPVAGFAVDGERSSMYYTDSCTHTNEEPKPWWTVDLEGEYLVKKVVITNRGNCCADRLSDFTISVGDSFDPVNKDSFDPSTFTQCTHVPGQLGAGETRVIQCNQPVRGRYVTVNLNQKNYLTICEFEVHGTPAAFRNLAFNQPSWQSSIYANEHDHGLSHEAVDGNASTDYGKKSCTHTKDDPVPWWTVDLEKQYLVTDVVITNRGDCCAERLSDFTVSVGNSFDPVNKDSFVPSTFTQCVHVPGQLWTGETRVIQCNQPVRGRYITVNLNQKNYLTICEFEVHGTPLPDSSDSSGEISAEETLTTSTYDEHTHDEETENSGDRSDAERDAEIEDSEDQSDEESGGVMEPQSINLALQKPVWQSSDFYGGVASRAVDGNRNSDINMNSCSHTADNNPPWITVDLEEVYEITEVAITNRGDCCSERLHDFTVVVGGAFDSESFNPEFFTRCSYVVGPLGEGETRTIRCDEPVVGRYVTVYQIAEKAISLAICELEVYGNSVDLFLEETVETFVCEHEVLNITCPADKKIEIISANYGRTERERCPVNYFARTDCTSEEASVRKLRELCDGRQSCLVKASNDIFGDSCYRVLKYLETTYKCTDTQRRKTFEITTAVETKITEESPTTEKDLLLEKTMKKFVCEHKTLDLICPADKKIEIIAANYGRTVTYDERCPYDLPKMRTDCTNEEFSLQIMRAYCDGQQSCQVKASNDIFGDPCYGTFKYLEVTYKCIDKRETVTVTSTESREEITTEKTTTEKVTEAEIKESEITQTPQKDKEDAHLNDAKEKEINESSLYNINNFFKQIKDETGKVMNIVISNVYQPPAGQDHPEKELVYVQSGYETYLLLAAAAIVFFLLVGIIILIGFKCAGYSCRKKQKDVHGHSSGQREAEKLIADIKTVYRV